MLYNEAYEFAGAYTNSYLPGDNFHPPSTMAITVSHKG